MLLFWSLSGLYLLFAWFSFRVIIKREYRHRRKLSPPYYLLETFVFACHVNLISMALEQPWPNIPPLPDGRIISIVGWTVFSVGTIILLVSWFRLGTKPSFGLDEGKLQTGGLYRYSRNPQMVGYSLMLIAIVIAYFSWMIIVWFGLYLFTMAFMIQSEEEFLSRLYGEDYKNYTNKVPRILFW